MRIGIVSVSYLPRLGGAVTQTILWHGYLTKHGHHVEVFCPDLSKHGRFQEDGIIVNRVRHRWARSYDSNVARVFLMNELRAAVQSRRKEFDVFITPEFNIGPYAKSFRTKPCWSVIFGNWGSRTTLSRPCWKDSSVSCSSGWTVWL